MILGFVIYMHQILYQQTFNTEQACEQVMQLHAEEFAEMKNWKDTSGMEIKCIQDHVNGTL